MSTASKSKIINDVDGCPAIYHGFKLFHKRKNGSLGPLFINRKQVILPNVWIPAEPHQTKGYKYRPGWHVCDKPKAPHLTEGGREWRHVSVSGVTELDRPVSQGGKWWLAKWIKVGDQVR
jgi:hypothetical protein